MQTVLNKARRPLKIHLSGGKVLHLGLGKEGQISDQDTDAPGVKRLLEAGDIEIVGGRETGPSGHTGGDVGRSEKHGHHPDNSTHHRGDR